jgi:hypothetical protein
MDRMPVQQINGAIQMACVAGAFSSVLVDPVILYIARRRVHKPISLNFYVNYPVN